MTYESIIGCKVRKTSGKNHQNPGQPHVSDWVVSKYSEWEQLATVFKFPCMNVKTIILPDVYNE